MVARGQDRRIHPRVVRPSLRLTLLGPDLQRLGDMSVVNASASGLLVRWSGDGDVPCWVGDVVDGVLWDVARAGAVPVCVHVVRLDGEEGNAVRLGVRFRWIEPSCYDAFQELIYECGARPVELAAASA